jgi:asparaginyl-tRNA synthetase
MATSTDATTEQLAACSIEGPTVYTSEKNGNDETGDGSEGKPFKTPLQAYRQHGENVTVYVDSKDETKGKW